MTLTTLDLGLFMMKSRTKMAAFWVVTLIALMMEAARTSETLVNFYQTTRRYTHRPDDGGSKDF
jgi:hypothetical protein